MPEQLLLNSGSPIWYKENVVIRTELADGDSPDNDDVIAKSAVINEIGLTTTK